MYGYVESDMQHIVRLFGERTKKYVFISTAATYLGPLILPTTEADPQGSHDIWGKYGIGNTIDRETLLFDRITKERPMLIPGDGEAVIQLGEVSDLCKALLTIAETPRGFEECYNISGNELVTLKSLVEPVAKIMGKECKTISVNPKDYGMTDREIFQFYNCTYFTTSNKFCDDFGWFPKTSLADGLTAAYNN